MNSTHCPLSVTIITLNEQKTIASAIQSVQWADEILVIDSGSTDQTVEIAKNLGARVIYNPWPGYGKQKNYAQNQAKNEWVLNLDGDERVPAELANEIQAALRQTLANTPGYKDLQAMCFPRKTFFLGRWIRHGGWYPNVLTRLGNRKHCQWSEPHVHEELEVNGRTQRLKNALDHFGFPSIHHQISTNLRLSKLGSEDLHRRGASGSLLKLLLKPFGKFVETYLLKFGFLDGLPGFIISINAAHSMFLKYAFLMEPKIRGKIKT
ncbi:glycosyltransferase family 2 protein [Bdellovibrionota bacterium FG-2]